jgi:hypothetical protein
LGDRRALQIGREVSLKAASTNRPFGKPYTRHMAAWLEANGLDSIGQQVRYRLLLVLENLPAIKRWRETLTEGHRLKLNHPDGIWMHRPPSKVAARAGSPCGGLERRNSAASSSAARRAASISARI